MLSLFWLSRINRLPPADPLPLRQERSSTLLWLGDHYRGEMTVFLFHPTSPGLSNTLSMQWCTAQSDPFYTQRVLQATMMGARSANSPGDRVSVRLPPFPSPCRAFPAILPTLSSFPAGEKADSSAFRKLPLDWKTDFPIHDYVWPPEIRPFNHRESIFMVHPGRPRREIQVEAFMKVLEFPNVKTLKGER